MGAVLRRGAGQEPGAQLRGQILLAQFHVRHKSPRKAIYQGSYMPVGVVFFRWRIELLLTLLLNRRSLGRILMEDEACVDLKSFKQKVRPGRRGRVSKFAPYMQEIRQLRRDSYTLRQICDWLATKRVKANVAALSVFLVRGARAGSKRKRKDRP